MARAVPGEDEDPGLERRKKEMAAWIAENGKAIKDYATLPERKQLEFSAELRAFFPKRILQTHQWTTKILSVGGNALTGDQILVMKVNPSRPADDYGVFIFDTKTLEVSDVFQLPKVKPFVMKSGVLALLTDPAREPVNLFIGTKKYGAIKTDKPDVWVLTDGSSRFEIRYDVKAKGWSNPEPVK